MIDEAKREAILNEVHQRFGVLVQWNKQSGSPGYRDDVTRHFFFDPEEKMNNKLMQGIRRYVEDQGWQFSRQLVKHPSVPDRQVEYVYLAPIIPVPLKVGYHVTRRVSLPSIKQYGLLPSAEARQTTERWDCEGNIYICEHLGTLADARVTGSESAQWWRAELAEKNRFSDPDWVILQVKAGEVPGARLYKDIWSKSGIIIDHVANIPWEYLEPV